MSVVEGAVRVRGAGHVAWSPQGSDCSLARLRRGGEIGICEERECRGNIGGTPGELRGGYRRGYRRRREIYLLEESNAGRGMGWDIEGRGGRRGEERRERETDRETERGGAV